MDAQFTRHGFLPAEDPQREFDRNSEFTPLDVLGHDLPSLLQDPGFREFARGLKIPPWPETRAAAEHLAELRLYYLRLGFLASAYINQVGQERATLLPKNIAVPLARACRLLNRPPILSYDGYALYNWKRFDPAGPIALGNIDTIQDFVHLYDEHWFILIHVEIEALAAGLLSAVDQIERALPADDDEAIQQALRNIAEALWKQVAVLRRIPEKMDPALYFKTFRPYIRFFEGVVYEGVDERPMDFRGETGAQSSVVPLLVSLLKVPHQPSQLMNHLDDMRNFMPAEHRAVLDEVESLPSLRNRAEPAVFNEILEGLATFREVHLGWAHEYINKRVDDPRGTGGTPYMHWLAQLIDETRGYKIG